MPHEIKAETRELTEPRESNQMSESAKWEIKSHCNSVLDCMRSSFMFTIHLLKAYPVRFDLFDSVLQESPADVEASTPRPWRARSFGRAQGLADLLLRAHHPPRQSLL
eukprot:TRINITY_DN11801_c0_g1_i1.p1 TRINITY_DN11801_c0_g1~~TRINITY_DN11801_c0_g1_i1.p1  ORF type:complete len:108 (+),score=15.91 TRINITY_DN11801_c0_g1_i1:165-488(+)